MINLSDVARCRGDQATILARQLITLLQQYIASLGFTPVIHFELEGCYQAPNGITLNFEQINRALKHLGIDGEVIPEYWRNQWEYVSLFNGQSPLKEADNLHQALRYLPQLFAKQGISKTLITPVVWSGDNGKMAPDSRHIFTKEQRAVHIPNAIQVNVSVNDASGKNIISKGYFGEYLQQCFLETSLACSLLYLPEALAFERFALKSFFGLAQELCSPDDISGGHQGSIALYKDKGKHNQPMGEKTLVVDQFQRPVRSEQDWHKTARIEHRLGAASEHYNSYINVIFCLLNIIDALAVYNKAQCQQQLKQHQPQSLPKALENIDGELGAIAIFERETWFATSINRFIKKSPRGVKVSEHISEQAGDVLKQLILARYRSPNIITEGNKSSSYE